MPPVTLLPITGHMRAKRVVRSNLPKYYLQIHNRIKWLCSQHRIGPTKLAKALDCSVSHASGLMRGQLPLNRLGDVWGICSGFGVSPNWLLFGVGNKYLDDYEQEQINAVLGARDASTPTISA